MIEDLKRDVEAASGETQGRRIHKAIMEGGRLDLLQPLPLRGGQAAVTAGTAVAEIAQATVAVAHVARSHSPSIRTVTTLLRQIRQLADDALRELESDEAALLPDD